MTAFVTFRLADSLPIHVIERYREERRILQRQLVAFPHDAELRKEAKRLFGRRIESLLDCGIGACHLRDPRFAATTLNALRHFDGERYVLHAACIMPNHVHLVLTLGPEAKLDRLNHSWKSFTSHWARNNLGIKGGLWQDESYDHIVRDEDELGRLIRYTLDNPIKARLGDWPYVFGADAA